MDTDVVQQKEEDEKPDIDFVVLRSRRPTHRAGAASPAPPARRRRRHSATPMPAPTAAARRREVTLKIVVSGAATLTFQNTFLVARPDLLERKVSRFFHSFTRS